MEFGLLIIGVAVGIGLAVLFDTVYYRESKSFTKAMDAAQDRIDELQAEMTELRREYEARDLSLKYLQEGMPGALLSNAGEDQDSDHARVVELETLLGSLRRESEESERRARLFEARLTDASSELASLRYGLPTLDRKAEDALETPLP